MRATLLPGLLRLAMVIVAVLLSPAIAAAQAEQIGTVRVLMETELGNIELELYGDQAPVTVANFLRYVDAGRYQEGQFRRSVRLDNQRRTDVLIEVIQGGTNRNGSGPRFDPIPLERTRDTGLLHTDGAVSMARGGPDSARSDFFICVGDQPSLDFGGDRNADGQGFAVFGRVVGGMDVVRAIHQSPTERGESLTPPIVIERITRID